jgi:hypothetical protein
MPHLSAGLLAGPHCALARHGRGALQGGLAAGALERVGLRRLSAPPLSTSDRWRSGSRAAARGRRPRSKCTVTRPPRPREHASRTAHRHVVSRGTLTLRSLPWNECGCRPSGTHRAKKATFTCDGAVTYSCTTNEKRNDAPHPHAPTAQAFRPTHPHTRSRTRGASDSR